MFQEAQRPYFFSHTDRGMRFVSPVGGLQLVEVVIQVSLVLNYVKCYVLETEVFLLQE